LKKERIQLKRRTVVQGSKESTARRIAESIPAVVGIIAIAIAAK
jgi:hypothetical protein